jgi:stage III sporulation protein SpoIIIAA
VRVLIIIGPPGAGKTTILTELMNLLAEEDSDPRRAEAAVATGSLLSLPCAATI